MGSDLGANATGLLLLRNELQKTKEFIGRVVEAIAANRECIRAMAEFVKASAAAEANVVAKPAPIDRDFLTLN